MYKINFIWQNKDGIENNLQLTGQENDLEKDISLDLQKKLKRKIQMINQENDLRNIFLLDLQRRLIKALKKSLIEQRRNDDKTNPTIVEWIHN